MRTKTSLTLAFAFTFSFPIFSPVCRAQQENDDPNWRERDLERRLAETKKLQKELDRLKQQLEEDKKRWDKQRESLFERLNRPGFLQKSRFLDIYDYGPIYWHRGLIFGKGKSNAPLSTDLPAT
jgi:hypothetical protein